MKQSRKTWTLEEDEAISSIVKKFGQKKWTVISQKMGEKFPQSQRTSKQCRQRWLNHLSPSINKAPWSHEELNTLFNSHKQFGNKWTEISQYLPGRTDNSIKNQFYSTFRKALRRIYRVLGTNNSTVKIKKIRPTILSLMITHYHQHQSQYNISLDIYQVLSEFADEEKYEKIKEEQLKLDFRENLQKILHILMDYKEFNKRKGGRSAQQKHGNQIIKNKLTFDELEQINKVGQQFYHPIKQQNIHIQNEQILNEQEEEIQGIGQYLEDQDIKFIAHDVLSKNCSQKMQQIQEEENEEEDEQEEEQIIFLQKALSIRRQNSQVQNPNLKNKSSSLSSDKNHAYRQQDQQNIGNFDFPFGEPFGIFPTLTMKESQEDSNMKLIDYENQRRLLGKEKPKLKGKQPQKRKMGQKQTQQKIQDIFQGFT